MLIGSLYFRDLQDYGHCRVLKCQVCVLEDTSSTADIVDSSPFQVNSSSDALQLLVFLLNATGSCATSLFLNGRLVKMMTSNLYGPKHLDKPIWTCPTSVDVSVLPHDRGPNFVLVGLFCIFQGLHCLLGSLRHPKYMSLSADSNSFHSSQG